MEAEQGLMNRGESSRVLIVDDEPDMVASIKFSLEKENIPCIEAYDGEEGLEMALAEKPAAIILDIMLPKMNGYKVARFLKADQEHKDIPILMLTARTQEKDVWMGLYSGAERYMAKPFDMDELVSIIKQFLSG